jgi:hypothetical protein
MRSHFMVVVIATATPLMLNGCNSTTLTDVPDAWVIQEQLDPLIVRDSQILKGTFRIRNPSPSRELILRFSSRSCSCLSWTLEESSIPPNGETIARLQGNVGAVSAHHQLSVSFETSLPTHPHLTLCLNVATHAPITLTPNELGALRRHSNIESSFYLDVTTADSTLNESKPIRVSCTDPMTRVRAGELTQTIEGSIALSTQRFCFTVAAIDLASWTLPNRGTMTVLVEHGINVQRREVSWELHRLIRCQPEELFIYANRRSASVTQCELVSEEAFAIKSCACTADGRLLIRARTNEHLTRHAVTVECVPKLTGPGVEMVYLDFTTDSPKQPFLRVPVRLLWRHN